MNITIQIRDDKNAEVSSDVDSNSLQSNNTTNATPTDGGVPRIEGAEPNVSSGGDTASVDIGGPPGWLTEEINASKASSTGTETSKELVGSDAGTAPVF